MNRIAAVTIALALCGCATQTATWVKAGSTQADYNRDIYDCERDMRQSGHYGTGVIGALTQTTAADFERRCMVSKGWTDQG